MNLDLARDTLFVTLAGSQAHGTARAGSDVDLRGVVVAPLPLRLSLFNTFEQREGPLDGPLWDSILPRIEAHPSACAGLLVKTECVLFDVAKFLNLCVQANPNALEVLFADPRDWLFEKPAWQRIYRERQRFLTTRVQQTYLGYALAQLKKIKTHRSWLLTPPKQKPTREALGLPDTGTLSRDDQNRIEKSIADQMRSYGIDTLEMPKPLRVALEARLRAALSDALHTTDEALEDKLRTLAVGSLNLPTAVVQTLEAERKYRAAMRHWEAYQTWQVERNPARAELERRFGYDTKHAMHLVRLMRTGLGLLRTGDLEVRRADASELTAIRDGKLSYDELLGLAAELESEMTEAAARTTLPRDVDRGFVDELAFELMAR